MTASEKEVVSEWWIYENWTAVPGGKAIVHHARCSWCNQGRGIHPDASDRYGRWLGPYYTKGVALDEARQLGRRETRVCMRCREWDCV